METASVKVGCAVGGPSEEYQIKANSIEKAEKRG
jgi:hypothetical protein